MRSESSLCCERYRPNWCQSDPFVVVRLVGVELGLLPSSSTAHRDFEKFPKYLGGQRRDLDKSPKMHLQGMAQ